MITYVESNFVLQLALGQEEAPSAEAILKLAENGSIELVFPNFALSEPFSTVTYHGVDRRRLYELLQAQLVQLQRSGPRSEAHQQVVDALQALLGMWREVVKRETASCTIISDPISAPA